MVIAEISPERLLRATREALGLKASADHLIDDPLLAALLRRTAGILCPCSPSTLRAAVLESLQYLDDGISQLSERIDAAVEGLMAVGDLLELSQITIDDPSVKGTWLFAAPPSFVVRSSGSVVLLGLSRDELTPLPELLRSRVVYEGFARIIRPRVAEDLSSSLRDLELLELSESVWLKEPKAQSADDLCEGMLRRLMDQPPSGFIDGLTILRPGHNVDYYAGRWESPKDESGSFVARRPQAYGAPVWGYALLEKGHALKFLDFPLRGSTWRGCDVAWHLQMATDYGHGSPQLYQVTPAQDGGFLNFYSPLPLWAQRRLTVIGSPVARKGCLSSFWLPEYELQAEEKFLQSHLWLARRELTD